MLPIPWFVLLHLPPRSSNRQRQIAMSKGQPTLYLIRHAQRADRDETNKSWHLTCPIPFDPPITNAGVEYSKVAGRKLASHVQGRKVILYTSPFQRCMQTALLIASQLPTRSRFCIDPTLSEWLAPHHFEPHPPCPQPGWVKQMLNRRVEELAREFTRPAEWSGLDQGWNAYVDIQWSFKGYVEEEASHQQSPLEESLLPYPEEHNNIRKRSAKGLQMALKSAYETETEVIIFVGHGHTVTTILEAALGESIEMAISRPKPRNVHAHAHAHTATTRPLALRTNSLDIPGRLSPAVSSELQNKAYYFYPSPSPDEKSSPVEADLHLMDLDVPPCSITRCVPSSLLESPRTESHPSPNSQSPTLVISPVTELPSDPTHLWRWKCDIRCRPPEK